VPDECDRTPSSPPVIVARGEPTEDELAAVTAVLLALAAARKAVRASSPGPGRAGWRRHAHGGRIYRNPISWR
jgi:acyl-CoA carboxylase epsilon subunit